jgi:hypothetical protein
MGTTELFQSERFGESLLSKGLFGEQSGHAIRSLVTERWIEEDELLNLAEFFEKLLHAQALSSIV